METIWKIKIRHMEPVEVPKTSEVLSVAAIGDDIFAWVKFDQKFKDVTYPMYFEVFGTGHDIPVDMGIDRKFIGTTLMYGGNLVWHIFERTD
jgi:hypothetical protein